MVQADGTLRLELIFLYSASGGGCNGQWMMSDAIRWYDQNISEVSRRYESVAANTVYGGWTPLLRADYSSRRAQATAKAARASF